MTTLDSILQAVAAIFQAVMISNLVGLIDEVLSGLMPAGV